MPPSPCDDKTRVEHLFDLQDRILGAVAAVMAEQSIEVLSRATRDGEDGDTIFQIDVDAEEILIEYCETWGRTEPFLLVAEGLATAPGRFFGAPGAEPAFTLIVDPIDGTRGLMFDKRSAWCLTAIASAETPTLADIEIAVMGELPTTRMAIVDRLWVEGDGPAMRRRKNLYTGENLDLPVRPSTATDLRHGFATVCNFFQGGKEITARIDEAIMDRALGGWRADKAELYSDQYISSGGQLAELMLGRDRFVLDVRPLVHQALGFDSTLCSRPYDLCTAKIAISAGCVVTAPDGSALDAPLDTMTNVAFVGYANQTLADQLQPIVSDVLREILKPQD